MPFAAEPPPHILGSSWIPETVVEQPALQTEEGLAFERRILDVRGAVLAQVRVGVTQFAPQEANSGNPMPTSSRAASYTIGPPRNEVRTSWVDLALQLFANSRNMTPQESAEFNSLSRKDLKPLSRPLK